MSYVDCNLIVLKAYSKHSVMILQQPVFVMVPVNIIEYWFDDQSLQVIEELTRALTRHGCFDYSRCCSFDYFNNQWYYSWYCTILKCSNSLFCIFYPELFPYLCSCLIPTRQRSQLQLRQVFLFRQIKPTAQGLLFLLFVVHVQDLLRLYRLRRSQFLLFFIF